MPEFTALIAAFGPTGAIIGLTVMAMRGIWPWLRDQYLARQVNAIEKLVAYMERGDARLAQLETNQNLTNTALQEIQIDLAALFTVLHEAQPSRPRQRQLGSQSVKAAR